VTLDPTVEAIPVAAAFRVAASEAPAVRCLRHCHVPEHRGNDSVQVHETGADAFWSDPLRRGSVPGERNSRAPALWNGVSPLHDV